MVKKESDLDELKDEVKAEAKAEGKVETKSERQVKWELHLAKYKEQNPAKYAAKKLEGSKVPDSFIG